VNGGRHFRAEPRSGGGEESPSSRPRGSSLYREDRDSSPSAFGLRSE